MEDIDKMSEREFREKYKGREIYVFRDYAVERSRKNLVDRDSDLSLQQSIEEYKKQRNHEIVQEVLIRIESDWPMERWGVVFRPR